MKIGILGMGGVGSFIGAKLTRKFENDENTKVIFICRGETKASILKNGLSLSTGNNTFNSRPDLVSDNPEEIGILDILIIATKSFSLATAVKQYQNCFDKDTVVIPLQNGINAKEIIKENTNAAKPNILEGCIYVISNIEKPGIVKHMGGPGKVFFGNEDESDFQWVEEILKVGGIDANYTKNIKDILWKKYLFLSPVAAMTTAFNITFGELAEDPDLMNLLEKMMKEVQQVADKFNVTLRDKDIQEALGMLSNFPFQAKSSLQLDVENKNDSNEKRYLVDYIIENGDKFGVQVDAYKKMSEKIAAYKMAATQNIMDIKASPEILYKAFTDPKALEAWLAPGEMIAKVHHFDLKVGGGYQMSLFYPETDNTSQGKTAAKEDRFTARFLELKPNEKIVQAIKFDTRNPDLAAEMIMETTFVKKEMATTVSIVFKNIPPGIRLEDNEAGTRSSLEKLACYVA